MAKVPTVVVYDRSAPRRMLYAHHLRTRMPLVVFPADSAAQVGALVRTADVLVLSLLDGTERAELLEAALTNPAISVVAIESARYDEAVYAKVSLRGHYVRQEHRLPSMIASITNILKQ